MSPWIVNVSEIISRILTFGLIYWYGFCQGREWEREKHRLEQTYFCFDCNHRFKGDSKKWDGHKCPKCNGRIIPERIDL